MIKKIHIQIKYNSYNIILYKTLKWLLCTIFTEILFAKMRSSCIAPGFDVIGANTTDPREYGEWRITLFDGFLTQSFTRLAYGPFLCVFVLCGACQMWNCCCMAKTGRKFYTDSIQSIYRFRRTRGWANNDRIIFFVWGWTVPLTPNVISSAGNLSSCVFRDESSSLVCALFKVARLTLFDRFFSLPLVSKTVSNFTVSSLRSSRLCDLCHIILLFFLHPLPLAQSVLAVVKKIQQMMDVFTLEEHFHGCTQSNHHNSTVFTETLSSSSSSLRALFTCTCTIWGQTFYICILGV